MKAIFALTFTPFALACTSVIVSTPQGDVTGRTMELPGDLESMWMASIHPRSERLGSLGRQVCGTAEWHNKYGFVSIDLPDASILPGDMPAAPLATDGMNEVGLSVSVQVLQGSTYAAPSNNGTATGPGVDAGACWLEMVPWLLAHFATVDEVRAAFNTAKEGGGAEVVGVDSSVFSGEIFPLITGTTWGIDDTFGNHAVIEVGRDRHDGPDGRVRVRIYDNTAGVLTNNPSFLWHLDNLDQYGAISPFAAPQPSPIAVHTPGAQFTDSVPSNAPGFGLNLKALPGSYSPADRFVRMFYLKRHVELLAPPRTAEAGMRAAAGLLANVFIVKGGQPDLTTTSYTVVKVPARRSYYYRTYTDSQWKVLDLVALSRAGAFGAGAASTAKPINTQQGSIVDVTAAFTRGAQVDKSKVALRG